MTLLTLSVRSWRWWGLLLCALVLVSPHLAQAEPVPRPVRVVGIVAGRTLNTASPEVGGEAGTRRYLDVLRRYGVSVRVFDFTGPVPPDVDLLVIIRPQRPLSVRQIAHVQLHLARGGHLLLALDPNGHNGTNTESGVNSGLSRLLNLDYGLRPLDDFLIEPWFSVVNLAGIVTSWSEAQPEAFIPHPITDPLVRYGLPVRYWGGRSLLVDALTGIARTNPLLMTTSPYGETGRFNLRDRASDPFILNIGADTQGYLLLASIGENRASGSRVALVGDSEIFQNLFGQTRVLDRDALPQHVGTYVFVERLTGWLLGISDPEWPPLPSGFTWIALDGDINDWPTNVPVLQDTSPTIPFYAITQVRALRNDQFVYVGVETISPLPRGSDVVIFLGSSADEASALVARSDGVVTYRGESVLDAAAAFTIAVELRLPRRLFPTDAATITGLCVRTSPAAPLDCYEGSVQPTATTELDPAPLRFGPGPQAFVLNGANLRQAPTTNAGLIVTLPGRTQLQVFGTNAARDWLFVRSGRYEGWMALFLVALNADVNRLPVLNPDGTPAELTP